MSETVIQVTSLGKRIKGKTILEDISFEINQGDCVALIGPNGAGKTVLMSCILGDKKPAVVRSSLMVRQVRPKIKLRFSFRKIPFQIV